MGITNFPGGVSSFGVPVMPGGVTIPPTTGKYLFAHSGTGVNDARLGMDPTQPLATIDYAVGLCTANKGDVIIVMPGHAENISSATSLVVDVEGVSVIGLGRGRNRPTLNFTDTAGSIKMEAANTRLSNMVLLADVSAVATGINVDANFVTLDNLEFNMVDTGDDFVKMIDMTSADDCHVLNCLMFTENAIAGADEGIKVTNADRFVIRGNLFQGQWATACISGVTTAGTLVTIAENMLFNSGNTNANIIYMPVGFTGLIARNLVGSGYAAAIAGIIDPGACRCLENYVCNAADESGAIIPSVLSA